MPLCFYNKRSILRAFGIPNLLNIVRYASSVPEVTISKEGFAVSLKRTPLACFSISVLTPSLPFSIDLDFSSVSFNRSIMALACRSAGSIYSFSGAS